MDTKRAVQEQFTAAAKDYGEGWTHASGPDLEAMLAAAGEAAGRTVLDVGAGAGHTAFAFAGAADHVVALDLTPAMLAETRAGGAARGLAHLVTQEGDAESIPFPDAHFDIVTSRLAAHHFPHIGRFVEQAHRVLRPGGQLIVSDTISPNDDAQDTYGNAIEVLRDPSHVRNHRVREWHEHFARAGFATLADHGRFASPLDFEVWTDRMNTPQAAKEGIQALFQASPSPVAQAFHIGPDGSAWQLEIAVLSATKA